MEPFFKELILYFKDSGGGLGKEGRMLSFQPLVVVMNIDELIPLCKMI